MPPEDEKFQRQLDERVRELLAEFTHATDRVAAISCAAYLDDALGAAIGTNFIKLGAHWKDRVHRPAMPGGAHTQLCLQFGIDVPDCQRRNRGFDLRQNETPSMYATQHRRQLRVRPGITARFGPRASGPHAAGTAAVQRSAANQRDSIIPRQTLSSRLHRGATPLTFCHPIYIS